jgi:DNA repair photolyase
LLLRVDFHPKTLHLPGTMSGRRTPKRGGRGTVTNPPNRFEKTHLEPLDVELPANEDRPAIPTRFYLDSTRTILARNDSPDIPFTYSLNPYRGCEHGCIYCYARASHEYLGFSAGLDFESKIMVKMAAPELLERELSKKSWKPQAVALSGNTDCYQPVERTLNLTRRCLEVFHQFRNPVTVVTKNSLIERDLDILAGMARFDAVHVSVSITTLDPDLAGRMEPRTSTPAKRLSTLRRLADAGVPVGVLLSPLIPGLTDQELPAILRAAADHGATTATSLILRLAGSVEGLFRGWLEREHPLKAEKVFGRLMDVRRGKLNEGRFGIRMTGEGATAEMLQEFFSLHARKYGLKERWEELSTDRFRVPGQRQVDLFEM